MRRTQIYLDEDLHQELQRLAAAEGLSAAAVIREALRRYLAEVTSRLDDPIISMIGTVSGLPRDAAAEHDRDLYGRPSKARGRR